MSAPCDVWPRPTEVATSGQQTSERRRVVVLAWCWPLDLFVKRWGQRGRTDCVAVAGWQRPHEDAGFGLFQMCVSAVECVLENVVVFAERAEVVVTRAPDRMRDRMVDM